MKLFERDLEQISSIFVSKIPNLKRKMSSIKEEDIRKIAEGRISALEKLKDQLPEEFRDKKKASLKNVDLFELLSVLADKIERSLLDFQKKGKENKEKLEDIKILRLWLPIIYDFKSLIDKVDLKPPRRFLRFQNERVIAKNFSQLELLDSRIAKEIVPVLKMPDPVYIARRLGANKKVGLLSRINRDSFVGKRMALINERLKKEAGVFLFGTLKLKSGKFIKSISDIKEEWVDGLTFLEFLPLDGIYFYELEEIDIHDPEKLRSIPPGRRFTASIDLPETTKAIENEEMIAFASPPNLVSLSDDELVELVNEFVDTDLEKSNSVTNAGMFLLQEIDRRKKDLFEDSVIGNLRKIADIKVDGVKV